MNAEGQFVPANRAWHRENRTYGFSYGLGAVLVLYGLMLCAHRWRPEIAARGSFLVIVMSLVTLSFLITTPESWVPALGDAEHGFPYLSGRGIDWAFAPHRDRSRGTGACNGRDARPLPQTTRRCARGKRQLTIELAFA